MTERRLGIDYSQLHIGAEAIEKELIPALQKLRGELAQNGVNPLLWFMFGSCVKEEIGRVPEVKSDAQLLVDFMLGIRGKNSFNPASDMDIGLIVQDAEYDTYLGLSNLLTSIKPVKGHEVNLTGFSSSWLGRQNHTIETLKREKSLSIYGRIEMLDIK